MRTFILALILLTVGCSGGISYGSGVVYNTHDPDFTKSCDKISTGFGNESETLICRDAEGNTLGRYRQDAGFYSESTT